MDFDRSADHALIRRTMRDFADGEVAPAAEELDRRHRRDPLRVAHAFVGDGMAVAPR